MKYVLKLEEAGLFILAFYLLKQLHLSWWWFPSLLLLPDLSMLAYLGGNKTGAIIYNIVHHKGLAVIIYLLGINFEIQWLAAAGIILLAHSSMDRMFGYGLKYFTGFQYTHLGRIGKKINQPE
jgi:hypothetical protein